MTMREFDWRSGRAEIEMAVGLEAGGASTSGTSKNIGIGGLFVTTDRSFQVGDRLTVQFSLPDPAQSVSVGAEVRWIRAAQDQVGSSPVTSGVGLRFIKLPIVSAIYIQEFLRRQDDDLTPQPA
jgi:uncharacterized protein (TIGR02266 family)